MAELDNTLNQMDPDAGDYFGVPSSPEQSQLVLVSVPWDATAPAGAVASYAPDAIIEVSARMDPYDPISPDEWKKGFATDDVDYTLQDRSQLLRSDVEKLRSYAASGGSIMGQLADDYYARRQRRVDDGCRDMVASVRAVSAGWLRQGKVVGLVGGDHSTPQGLIEALAAREPGIGILHMDARCRLKARCEGFEYSCESLMYNVLKNVEGITALCALVLKGYAKRKTASGVIKIIRCVNSERSLVILTEYIGENLLRSILLCLLGFVVFNDLDLILNVCAILILGIYNNKLAGILGAVALRCERSNAKRKNHQTGKN